MRGAKIVAFAKIAPNLMIANKIFGRVSNLGNTQDLRIVQTSGAYTADQFLEETITNFFRFEEDMKPDRYDYPKVFIAKKEQDYDYSVDLTDTYKAYLQKVGLDD